MTSGRKDKALQHLTPLAGRTFTLKRWKSTEPEWTHDHCRGCRSHICDSDDDDAHDGYVTIDAHGDEDWVCPKCFQMYHLVLKFRVQST